MNHQEIEWANKRIGEERRDLEKLQIERSNLKCNGQNTSVLFCGTRRLDLHEVSRETSWQAKHRRGMEMISLGLIKWYDAEIERQELKIAGLKAKLVYEVMK